MSTARSGLGTLRRDWSNASDSAASSSAELVEWEPTQRPKKREPPTDKTKSAERRLQLIRDALASTSAPKSAPTTVTNLLSKSAVADPNRPPSKRPTVDQDDAAPAKKRRELPSSWRDDTLSDPGLRGKRLPICTSITQTSGTQGSSSSSSTSTLKSSTSTRANQVAGIFLSQEQTHIMKLVKEGCSVFYTGSAGVFFN
jgi:hypothetical protein